MMRNTQAHTHKLARDTVKETPPTPPRRLVASKLHTGKRPAGPLRAPLLRPFRREAPRGGKKADSAWQGAFM